MAITLDNSKTTLNDSGDGSPGSIGAQRILPERVVGEVIIEAPQSETVLGKRFVKNLKKSDTTPDVSNTEVCRAKNTGAVTVTNFTGGADGQRLWILGDGFTTLQHGTNIFTFAAANLLLLANKVYALVGYLNVAGKVIWYQY